MWYWLLNLIISLWVFFDARNRKMKDALMWGFGTFFLMIIVIPFYFAKRTLKPGETREGGLAWNVMKSFAIFWTLFMFVAGIAGMVASSSVVNKASSNAEQAGAAIGVFMGLGLIGSIWFVILVGALVLGLFLKKSSIVEKGPEEIAST